MSAYVQQQQSVALPVACRRSLVSAEKPLDAALYASYEELRAFCQTWGLYGIREMASRSETAVAEAMALVDTALRMHEPLLQRLKAEYLVCPTQCHNTTVSVLLI